MKYNPISKTVIKEHEMCKTKCVICARTFRYLKQANGNHHNNSTTTYFGHRMLHPKTISSHTRSQVVPRRSLSPKVRTVTLFSLLSF